jgi:hypothetical protein
VSVSALVVVFSSPARAADGGETIWTRTWGDESQGRFRYAEPCADGDVIVAGYVQTTIGKHIVSRYVSSGERRWVRVVAAASALRDSPSALAVDGSGNALVSGYREVGAGGFDAVAPDNAGGCYVAGGVTVNYHDIGNEVEVGYLARYRASGAIRWERAYAYVGRRATFFGMAAWPHRGLCLVGGTRDWDNTEGEALVQLRRK